MTFSSSSTAVRTTKPQFNYPQTGNVNKNPHYLTTIDRRSDRRSDHSFYFSDKDPE